MATLLHHFENLLKMAKFKVLDIIQNNPILYDTEHENFYNAKLKSLAKLAVLKECTSMLPSEITFEVLTRKIRNFQRSYNRRKKKPKVSPNLYNSQHKICTQNCNLLISFCCDVFFFSLFYFQETPVSVINLSPDPRSKNESDTRVPTLTFPQNPFSRPKVNCSCSRHSADIKAILNSFSLPPLLSPIPPSSSDPEPSNAKPFSYTLMPFTTPVSTYLFLHNFLCSAYIS